MASVDFEFNGRPVKVVYKNTGTASSVRKITVDGVLVSEGADVLPKDKIGDVIEVELA